MPVPTSTDTDARPLQVAVSSEIGRLRTVIMCLANPWRTPPSTLRHIDVAGVHQMLRNRWRPYDHAAVREQQLALIELLRGRGTEVLLADNLTQISQHYTRDIGFAVDDVFVVARPRRPYRSAEIPGIRTHLRRMSRVAFLDDGSIEGGDVMLTDGHVLVGLGEETDLAGVRALAHRLAEEGNPRRVVPLRFAHRGVVHLDTKLNVVGPHLALVHRRSFTPESLRRLQEHFDLVDATDEEVARIEVNTVAVEPGVVLVQARSGRLADELARRGITPVPVDYSAVTRLPGSLRCTTLPVRRDAVPPAG